MKILIFDYDGVIVNSLDPVLEFYNDELSEKYNFKKFETKKEFTDLFKGNLFESLIKRGVDKDKMPSLIKDLQIELDLLQDTIPLMPGIKPALTKLAKNNKLIIVTSNITQIVENYLKKYKIEVFDKIIGAEQEPSKTKKILSIKKQYPKAEVYYIGDTSGDVIEGKAAGVKTVAASWGWHTQEELLMTKPDFIVNSAKDLVALFSY